MLKLLLLSVFPASQLNLSRPIEEQGPLDVIIHKLTDVILEADQNDSQSLELVHRFQVSENHVALGCGIFRRRRGGPGMAVGVFRAVAALWRYSLEKWLCHWRDMGLWAGALCVLSVLGCSMGTEPGHGWAVSTPWLCRHGLLMRHH